MKGVTSRLLAVLMFLSPLSGSAGGTYSWQTESNGDGTVTIVGIKGQPTGFVQIPETIDGQVVTGLGAGLFYEQEAITEIVIPDTVRYIGSGAFLECHVEKITLPHTIEEINCTYEEGDYIVYTDGRYKFAPQDWGAIGGWSPFDVNHLKSISFSNGKSSNDDGTYYLQDGMLMHRCTFESWYSDIVPAAYKTVVNLIGIAGYGRKGKLVVPDGVHGILPAAFEDLGGITELSLPASLISLGGYGGGAAFGWMEGLERIVVRGTGSPFRVIGNSLVDTRTRTLVQSTKNTVIPSDGSVTKIALWAFCAAPETVVIPDCVTTIAPSAFCCADFIKRIEVGAGAVEIGGGAFANIGGLEEFAISEKNPKYEVVNDCVVEKTGLRSMISTSAHPRQYKNIWQKKWTYYTYDCHVPYFCRGIVDRALKDENFVVDVDLPKNLTFVPGEYYSEGLASHSYIRRVEIADCSTDAEAEASATYRELSIKLEERDCTRLGSPLYKFQGCYYNNDPQIAVRARGRLVADGFGRYVPGSKITLTARPFDANMVAAWLDEKGVTNCVGNTFVVTMPKSDVLYTIIPVKATSVDGSKVIRIFDGTSTTEKKYAAGAKVSLAAKGPKGEVFAGWYLDADFTNPFTDLQEFAGVDFRSAKATYKRQPGCDPDAVYARFVDKSADMKIDIAFEHTPWNIGSDGSPAENAVIADSLTAVKLTFKGLPKGVKYVNGKLSCDFKNTTPGSYTITVTGKNASNFAKSVDLVVIISNKASAALPNLDATIVYSAGAGVVVDESLLNLKPASGWMVSKVGGLPSGMKETKDKQTGAWSVLGVPTKPGAYTVTVIATNAAKQQEIANVTIRVDSLPDVAFGDFSGYAGRAAEGSLVAYRGRLTFSVSSAGKISAKVINADGTASFSTVGWDKVDSQGRYVTEMLNKKGEVLAVSVNPALAWTRRQTDAGAFSPLRGVDEPVEFSRTTPYANKQDEHYADAQAALAPFVGKYNARANFQCNSTGFRVSA